jgi:hypothetical protein
MSFQTLAKMCLVLGFATFAGSGAVPSNTKTDFSR